MSTVEHVGERRSHTAMAWAQRGCDAPRPEGCELHLMRHAPRAHGAPTKASRSRSHGKSTPAKTPRPRVMRTFVDETLSFSPAAAEAATAEAAFATAACQRPLSRRPAGSTGSTVDRTAAVAFHIASSDRPWQAHTAHSIVQREKRMPKKLVLQWRARGARGRGRGRPTLRAGRAARGLVAHGRCHSPQPADSVHWRLALRLVRLDVWRAASRRPRVA